MVKKLGTEPAADSGNRNGLVKSKDSQNREKSHSQLDDLKELRDSLKERGFLPDWRIIAGLCVLILGAILLVGILWSIPSIKAAESLTTLFIVIIGALIVVAVLPRIQGFKFGKEGFEAQFVTREEFDKKLEEYRKIIDDIVLYSMRYPVFECLCKIATSYNYDYNYKSEPVSYEEIRSHLIFLHDHGFIKSVIDDEKLNIDELENCNLVDRVKPTPIGWFCIKLRGEKEEMRRSLEKEEAENVKTYVWDVIREETDYPFKIPERIAEYEAKDEKRWHDEIVRALKELLPQTSFDISYIPHKHKLHIERSATLVSANGENGSAKKVV